MHTARIVQLAMVLTFSASVCAAQEAAPVVPRALKLPTLVKPPVTPPVVKPPVVKPSVTPPGVKPPVTPSIARPPVNQPVARQPVVPLRQVVLPGGRGTASYSSNGRLRSLDQGPMRITRSQMGVRQVRVERPDRSVVFIGRGGHGYVERPYSYQGRTLLERTYYAHGASYARFYRPYAYHGLNLAVYTPVRYYPPGYYSWVYYSQAPVPFVWVSPGSPSVIYYGPYFTPGPVDPGPPVWLADYVISSNLDSAYQARIDESGGYPPPPLSGPSASLDPQVKQAIAEEVQRQITRENTEAQQVAGRQELDPASSGLGRMLDNTSHVFVTGADLEVVDRAGQECALSPGDAIQLAVPPDAAATAADLVVLASKPQECPKGDLISVNLTDLQEMLNHMRETIDDGLAALQAHTGMSGWPTLPQSAGGTGTTAPFAAQAPPPEPNVAVELAAQSREADQAERAAGAVGRG